MPNAFAWSFKLDDGLSGPARKMDDVLGTVESRLGDMARSLVAMDSPLGRVSRRADAADASLRRLSSDAASLKRPAWMDSIVDHEARGAEVAAKRMRLANPASVFVEQNEFAEKQLKAGRPSWMQEILDKEAKSAEVASRRIKLAQPASVFAKDAETAGGKMKGGFFAKLFGGGGLRAMAPELFVAAELGRQVLHVGESFAEAAIGVSRFAIAQSANKEQTIAAMSVLAGSKDQAEKHFRLMQKLADLTPFEDENIQQPFMSLMGAGLNVQQTVRALAAMSDLGSAGGTGAGGIQRMGLALQDMIATNRLDQRHLNEFAMGSGGLFNEARFLGEIAQAKKVSTEAAKAMLSSGRIKAMEGLRFIEQDIAKNIDHGALGTMAEKLGIEQLNGQVSTLKNNFERLFQDIDISPITGALSDLNGLLDQNTDTGKRLKDVVDTLFGDSFKAFFEQYSGPQGAKAMREDFERLLGVAEKLAAVLDAAAKAAAFLFNTGKTFALGSNRNTTTAQKLGATFIDGVLASNPITMPLAGLGANAFGDPRTDQERMADQLMAGWRDAGMPGAFSVLDPDAMMADQTAASSGFSPLALPPPGASSANQHIEVNVNVNGASDPEATKKAAQAGTEAALHAAVERLATRGGAR